MSNTSDPQYANQRYIISYNSITGNEESVLTNEGEWSKSIQLPYNDTYCFTVTPMNYSDSGLAKSMHTIFSGIAAFLTSNIAMTNSL